MTWTCFTGLYVKKQLVVRLRFGEPADIRWPSKGTSGGGGTRYWFTAGQVFGVAWWARLSPRKQIAGFAVVEALHAGESGSGNSVGYRLACIAPAVRVHTFLLTRAVGQDRGVVDAADTLIRDIERSGIEPARVPGAYYAAAGQSLRVKRTPRRLSVEDLSRFERSYLDAH